MFVKQTTVVTQVTNDEELRTDKELNLEEVRSTIFRYAEENFKSSNRLVYSTLTEQPAELSGETEIVIPIHNEVQIESFREHSQNFLDHLRRTLSNGKISFTFREAEIKTEKKIYTPKDKFHHLANKNPLIVEMSKRFNLEIDF